MDTAPSTNVLPRGSRLFLFGELLGAVSHVLFDSDSEPIYFTDNGQQARHFELACGQVTHGNREHYAS